MTLREAQETWLDRELAHQVLMLRFARGMALRAGAKLEREVLSAVAAEVAQRLVHISRGRQALALRNTQFLLRAVREIVRDGSAQAKAVVVREAQALAELEVRWLVKVGDAALGVQFETPAPSLVRAAMERTELMGRKFGAWFEEWVPRRTEAAVVARVQAGLVAGESTPAIIEGLQGTEVGSYRNGVLAPTRQALETLVRTTATHTNAQARDLTFRANADVVAQVRWHSVLDLRTTIICAQLDGKVWAVTAPHPVPPAHFNCRSQLLPFFGDYLGKRASMDGPVPAELTFAEWVQRQPAARQNEIFGVTRARAFRAGQLDLADMVDEAGLRVLTLDELRALERL